MESLESEFEVDFPTLGFVVADWIEAHCIIPDGFHKGRPYLMADWQLWCCCNHYRVREDASWDPELPRVSTNFVYRRSQVVAPQKTGKGPWAAAIICAEALGPTVFVGWAEEGDVYDCADHGCECGWSYEYEPGEPMGMPRPSPLIQCTATAKDQTANVYRPLKAMFKGGWITEAGRVGEEFIRVGEDGRIDTVTSSARARLGNPVTFVLQDEAMDLETPLPTPTGWTTMGEIRTGEELIGSDGRPVRVTKVTEVQYDRDCYRVTFADGTSVVTSDGHLWLTYIAGSRAKAAIRTTGEMAAAPTHYPSGPTRRFRVPTCLPYDLPSAQLPVDPYFLGVWLGDGSKGKAEIACGEEDVEEMERLLADVGVKTVRTRWAGAGAHSLLFSARAGYQGSGRPQVAKDLQALSCYRSKHIPEAYFRGSLEQRVALLQGLMDTDGHVTETGFCTFAGTKRLTADMVVLLRTLGIHSTPVSRADSRAKTGFGWKVNFTPRGALVPFRLQRKMARVRSAWAGSDRMTITSIVPVESVPVRCIGVDSEDHLFVAGEGAHLTHNTGIYTKSNGMREVAETQRRGLAGMDARSIETTNSWDPSEESVAQRTWESTSKDIFKFYRPAPASLDYRKKDERRLIHAHVYAGSWWVNLDAIEAEAAELLEKDLAQAERFFGNRRTRGLGTWVTDDIWENADARARVVPDGIAVAGGFDGSDVDDWSAIRLVTPDGFRFTPTYGPDKRPAIWDPTTWNGSIPRGEVHAAWDEICSRYNVLRAYCDPRDWQSEIGDWGLKYGEKVFVEWATNRITQMHAALERSLTDLKSGRATHDGCEITTLHVGNARKAAKPGGKYILVKASPSQKIDAAMSDALAQEAWADATAAGDFERALAKKKSSKVIVMR